MGDVDRLLSEYIAEHRAGGDPDPNAYLDRVGGADRRELEALMDAFLEAEPGDAWDPQGFTGSASERFVQSYGPSLIGDAGLWPALLPRLRDKAQLKRSELVARLASALGVSGKEEKVAAYYHRMEQGSLPVDGVSDRVLEALGSLLGRTAASLRAAGEGFERAEPPPLAGGPVFARATRVDPGYAAAPPPPPAAAPQAPEPWDEVDQLFRGG